MCIGPVCEHCPPWHGWSCLGSQISKMLHEVVGLSAADSTLAYYQHLQTFGDSVFFLSVFGTCNKFSFRHPLICYMHMHV